MSVVLESKENNKAVFTVEVSQEDFQDAIKKAYAKNKSRFNVPGFRKGKVPMRVIEMNYGKEIFYEDAVNILLPDAYENGIEELDLNPVSNPEIDIENIDEENPIVFKFEVDVRPEPVLGDYSNLEAEIDDFSVTDADINAVIEKALETNARVEQVEREAKEGDSVNINFEGSVDGEVFEGGTAENYDLTLGSNSFIPGFEEQLVGVKPGEEVDVNVTFPEDYHEESLANKESLFKVKMNSISEKIRPELDDEFVKDISEFDTLDEYKADIRTQLEKESEESLERTKQNKAIEALVNVTEMEIPESMINNQLDQDYDNFTKRIQSMGLGIDQYFTITNSSEEQVREELRGNAENQVKADLALDALVVKENPEVTDEDMDAELDKLAEQYSPDDKEKFIDNMKNGGSLDFIKDSIIRKKAVQKLIDSVDFKVKNKES